MRAGRFRRCSTAAVSALPMRMRQPAICTWYESAHDPLCVALRTRTRVRKLVPGFAFLREAGQARPCELSDVRFGQGREVDHGAADSAQGPERRTTRRRGTGKTFSGPKEEGRKHAGG